MNKWTTPAPPQLLLLTLHQRNIGGRLVNENGLLTLNAKHITMYDNQLSCESKSDNENNGFNYNYRYDNDTSLVLLGNLFSIKSDNANDIGLLRHDPFTEGHISYTLTTIVTII